MIDPTESIFERLKQKINKNVKGAHVAILSQSDIATNRYWIKTPALDLNRILSGSLNKGIQSRNLVGICGPEHSMKTSFMILCMVEAQKEGKIPVIIDTEGAITKEFCGRWGLDRDKVLYTYTPFVHEVKGILGQIRDDKAENFIIGLDSVGGLERYKQFEDAATGEIKADQGLLQKEIRGMLKLFLNICISQNSIGIATAHMYGSPGRVPMPDQIGGGKAVKLFPSILIQLKKKHMFDKDRNIIGNEIDATTIKNRSYPPFQTAVVGLSYKDGIQPYAGILELGIKANIIELSGAWYNYKGERLGQGRDNAMEALNNINISDIILPEIDKWLENTGYSTISKEIKEAEEIIQSEIQIAENTEEEKPKRGRKRNEDK
jgi:recombination protein RecA